MDHARRRFALVLSLVALAAGVGGYLAALGEPFTNPKGSLLGKLLYFNRLGAVATSVLAAAALAGALARRRDLLVVVGVGFALAAVLTILQTGGDPNWLGGRGNTLSLFLACAVGLLTVGLGSGARGGPGTVSPPG
jgi:peptidoglycan/LPS O-acetylase OafA/YrhL